MKIKLCLSNIEINLKERFWAYHSARTKAFDCYSYSFVPHLNTSLENHKRRFNIFHAWAKKEGLPNDTVARVMAVAWAAIFVPSRVFLNPSLPQLCRIFTIPASEEKFRVIIIQKQTGFSIPPSASVSEIKVLLGEALMLQMGRSAKRIPSKRRLGRSSSGKMFCLQRWDEAWYGG